MTISDHAQRRFALRVDAMVEPCQSIRKMWNDGRDATDDDLEAFRVRRVPGYRYRVGRHKKTPHRILVSCGDCIVTIR